MITVSGGDRRRQDSPLCDRHLPRHVRAVNHRLNGKALWLCSRAKGTVRSGHGNVHAPTRALISRQDTGGCEQTRRHAVEMSARSGKKDGGCICGGCVARGKASERIEIAGGKLVVGRVDCLINWYIADTLDDDDADKSHGKVNNVMFIRDVYTIYWLVGGK